MITGEQHQRPLVLVAVAGPFRVAFPLTVVREVLRMAALSALPGAPTGIVGVLDLRGSLVPVVDLAARLGGSDRRPELDHRLVVVEVATGQLLLWVDDVRGLLRLQDDEVEPLAGRLGANPSFAGGARSEDGLLFVHDVDAFLDHEAVAELELALSQVVP